MKNNPETQIPKTEKLMLDRAGEPSVAMMLQKVIDGGITSENVTALESLVGLYDRMQAKKAEMVFATAFSKLQSSINRIQATHVVPDKQGVTKYHVAKFQEVWNE